eukprot:1350603-Lingulodinium_polyedra.AAC.1
MLHDGLMPTGVPTMSPGSAPQRSASERPTTERERESNEYKDVAMVAQRGRDWRSFPSGLD